MTKEELLKMELHEIKNIPCHSHDITVLRVFGGWVYTQVAWDQERDIMTSSSSCFVPEVLNVDAKNG